MRLTDSPTRQRGWSIQSAGKRKPHHRHIIIILVKLTHSRIHTLMHECLSLFRKCTVDFYVVITRTIGVSHTSLCGTHLSHAAFHAL